MRPERPETASMLPPQRRAPYFRLSICFHLCSLVDAEREEIKRYDINIHELIHENLNSYRLVISDNQCAEVQGNLPERTLERAKWYNPCICVGAVSFHT